MQNDTIHAFVPGFCSDQLEQKLAVGNVVSITNFTVQQYKVDDKFRPLRNDQQLVFSTETRIKQIEDPANQIEDNFFDFYDLSELKEMSKQNTYLAGISLFLIRTCI